MDMEVQTGHCEVVPALPEEEESNVTAACEKLDAHDAANVIEITETENNENEPSDENYYSHGANYWSQVPATVDGMLGGFGYISHTDIQGSEAFLKSIFKLKHPPGRERTIDCGAGIGRVTKLLLQKFFTTVDLVEQNPSFLNEAKSYLGSSKHIGQMYCEGLQSFKPEENAYDVIWCQWVLGQIKDNDLVNFMKSNARALKENGVIVVKENVTSSGDVEEDKEDASVTRSEEVLLSLLTGPAGLRLVREMKQPRFPKGLFPVRMYALRPRKEESALEQCTNGTMMNFENNS